MASARPTCWGSAWRAWAVGRGRSGTMATNTSPASRGMRTARTAPRTRVAATRPPTTEAAAFSGWPSTRAATPRGSLEPAAAAAATARAAEDPSPRATGISERTVMARWSCPDDVDGHARRQVHVVVVDLGPFALGSHHQAGGRLDLDLDVEVEGQGQHVEARAQVGGGGRGTGAHDSLG